MSKLTAIRWLDWLDDRILRHRFRPLCDWIAWSAWWDADEED